MGHFRIEGRCIDHGRQDPVEPGLADATGNHACDDVDDRSPNDADLRQRDERGIRRGGTGGDREAANGGDVRERGALIRRDRHTGSEECNHCGQA